jgi:Flp pilus assembly pilin Flp
VTKKNSRERGGFLVEYGLTVGAIALTAAALYAHSSPGVTGIWKQANAVSMKSSAAQGQGPTFIDCMANAHGDSKVCSSAGH